MKRAVEQRFWSKVDRSGGDDACWPWRATRLPAGYGLFYLDGRPAHAHVFAFVSAHGSVPPGLEVAHSCGNPWCVNPCHLHAKTHRANLLEGVTNIAVVNARKTHCPAGHPYSVENTLVSGKGQRECRECKKAANRRQYLRRKVAKGAA